MLSIYERRGLAVWLFAHVVENNNREQQQQANEMDIYMR